MVDLLFKGNFKEIKMKIIFVSFSLILATSCATINSGEYAELKIDESLPLIIDEMESDSYLAKFYEVICNNGAISKEDCNTKYLETFGARLSERYEGAPSWMIDKYCKSNPIDCKGFRNYEKAYLKVHNQEVEKFKESYGDLLYSDEIKKEWRRHVAVLNGAKFSSTNETRPVYIQAPIIKPSQCESKVLGNTLYTDCR